MSRRQKNENLGQLTKVCGAWSEASPRRLIPWLYARDCACCVRSRRSCVPNGCNRVSDMPSKTTTVGGRGHIPLRELSLLSRVVVARCHRWRATQGTSRRLAATFCLRDLGGAPSQIGLSPSRHQRPAPWRRVGVARMSSVSLTSRTTRDGRYDSGSRHLQSQRSRDGERGDSEVDQEVGGVREDCVKNLCCLCFRARDF